LQNKKNELTHFETLKELMHKHRVETKGRQLQTYVPWQKNVERSWWSQGKTCQIDPKTDKTEKLVSINVHWASVDTKDVREDQVE